MKYNIIKTLKSIKYDILKFDNYDNSIINDIDNIINLYLYQNDKVGTNTELYYLHILLFKIFDVYNKEY